MAITCITNDAGGVCGTKVGGNDRADTLVREEQAWRGGGKSGFTVSLKPSQFASR